jgi:hypothetical protein
MVVVVIIGALLTLSAYLRGVYGYGDLRQNICTTSFRDESPTSQDSITTAILNGVTIALSLPFVMATLIKLIKQRVTTVGNSGSVMFESSNDQQFSVDSIVPSSSRTPSLDISYWLAHLSKYKSLITFMVIIIATTVVFAHEAIVRAFTNVQRKKYLERWSECVFLHYDRRSDKSWMNVCGKHPHRVVSTSEIYFNRYYMASIGLVFSFMFFPIIMRHLENYDIVFVITTIWRNKDQNVNRVAPLPGNNAELNYIGVV